jgi:hypothetical protein
VLRIFLSERGLPKHGKDYFCFLAPYAVRADPEFLAIYFNEWRRAGVQHVLLHEENFKGLTEDYGYRHVAPCLMTSPALKSITVVVGEIGSGNSFKKLDLALSRPNANDE